MDQLTDALEASLELVAERCGDPTERVYDRLFARQPEMEALFLGDQSRQARGHMLQMVLDTLTGMADGAAWPANMIRAEKINHDQIGVPFDVFATFFGVIHETFREAGGEDWTAEMETAWTDLLARAAAV
ncbi:MAG: globin [Caulobacter sp.]|nr:globin [Caulobacter sp.]